MNRTGAGVDSVWTQPARHRFLSPHYDDIALSCGGTVALLAQSGVRPEIEVVFGAEPDSAQPLSPFASELHRQWGLDAEQVIRERRQEEAAAASLLGATSISLSRGDAIYRGTSYQNDEQLRGPIAGTEAALPTRIAAELGDDPEGRGATRFYAPLGVGQHVDHQICFAAALELAAAGWDVWFYEDIPYALTANALGERLERVAETWHERAPAAIRFRRLEPATQVDITPVWETKLAAILAYPSQVPTIFRHVAPDASKAQIDAALRAYATRRDGVVSEYLWRLGPGEGEPETR